MCESCYLERSTGRLGFGHGQYLITPDEVPAHVLTALERANAYWARRGA
jgi:hypothetical protein